MRGKVIRAIGGYYYVHAEDGEVYACRARGIFRKKDISPLVGDDVDISVTSQRQRAGSLDTLLPRKNELTRPAAANVDQAMIIFSLADPSPNLGLLDRFLILMARQNIPVLICFNKTDLAKPGQIENLESLYENCGCPLFFLSLKTDEGIDRIRETVHFRTTILAGPSGVGKSSLTNALLEKKHMKVGDISRKIGRGKNTTRHTEFIVLRDHSYLLDTPGFSSLDLPDMAPEELRDYYPEFDAYAPDCRFKGCMHQKEPDCAVKAAVEAGRISRGRYESYLSLAEELREQKKY